jgi:tRNA(fMet)-specific endonuclease VapC
MKYLLDTNICIYWFKGSMGIDIRVSAVDINDVSVSSITIAELLYGAYNSANIDKNISKVKEFEDTTKKRQEHL